MNLLMIVADDMTYDPLSNLNIYESFPAIKKLSQEGCCFHNGHTTVGLCQPARSVMMTGMYPWNNGATGFNPIRQGVNTLPVLLKNLGFSLGIIGKTSHLAPVSAFPWDFKEETGRDVHKYERLIKSFFNSFQSPFFLMVNSHDPHRPFPIKPIYKPEDMLVPEFLEDTPDTRMELARYYTGVRNCDKIVEVTLEQLGKQERDTLVIFTSDHGMAFPFSKAHCYHFSTRIPLIYKLKGAVEQMNVNELVSGVDMMPTILETMGINVPITNGESYSDLLKGKKQERRHAYTCLIKNYFGTEFQTRALHNSKFCYVRNFWANKEFSEDGCLENQPSFMSLNKSKKHHIRNRTPQELYDVKNDPYGQNNLSEVRPEIVREMTEEMRKVGREANDEIDKLLISQIKSF